jgi:predicted HAD superfamily Cof-like phosphohydrolase
MFTQQLPAALFQTQREFIAAMDANRDFVWWAETLIVEETKELDEAYGKKEISDENMADIFKELADVIYVVAGFYNTMPVYAPELISAEMNQRLQDILDEAATVVSKVTQKLQIPLPLVVAAFEVVHASNMSKLDENGQPIRREDGKIMKGPNYVAPDMMPIVTEWKNFQQQLQEANNAPTTH